MKMALILQAVRLGWLRFNGPLQRLAVILQYHGLRAAKQAIRERLFANSMPHTPVIPWEPLTPREDTTLPDASPLVSVIVRTHNRPHLLRDALTGLVAQSLRDFEVVLVNDGESSVSDPISEFETILRIRVAGHKPGSGRTEALNSGVREARGRFLTYLDDDDRVYPNHLQTLVGGFTRGVDAVYSQAEQTLCWARGNDERVVTRTPCVSRPFDLTTLLVDNWIPFMTLMHRRECLEQAGAFDASLELFEDWDFLIRLGRCCHLVHVPVITCEYRYRFGAIPEKARSAVTARERIWAATQRIYERYPVADAESCALRRLTLNALKRDVEEVAWIEATVRNPLLRDLRSVAWAARFPDVSAYRAELVRQGAKV